MYQYKSRVSYSQVDSNLKLNYFSLINYMQDCSCFHADDLGVGVHYLAPKKMGWFVTTYEIHINRMPDYMERIVISTYPYQVKGMMARRIYTIETEDGELLVYADSLWLLMNLEKLAPARMTAEIIDAYPEDTNRPVFQFERSKLKLANEGKRVGKFVVNENYIDTNSHMNNSYYIDVTRRFLPSEEFTSITVNYKKAAMLFDELDVYLVELEQGYQVVLKKDDEIYTIVEYK